VNGTELLAMQVVLANAAMQCPTLALANAAAWLDPLLFCDRDEWEDDFTEAGDLVWVTGLCREHFPDLYATALHTQRADLDSFGDTLRTALLEKLPLQVRNMNDDLEQLRGGPSIACFGFDLGNSDFYDGHDNFTRLAVLFGLRTEADIPHCEKALEVARMLNKSLLSSRRKRNIDLAYTIQWLFSMSGNTVLDFTYDDLYESGLEAPSWDQLDLIKEIYQEVTDFQQRAHRTFKALRADKAFLEALKENIRRANDATSADKPKSVTFEWPKAACRHTG